MVVRQRSSDSESRKKGNEDIQKESEIIPFHRHSTINSFIMLNQWTKTKKNGF